VLAGNGIAGYADGSGTNARFNSGVGMALVSNQYIFVGDRGSKVIRRVTTSGIT
jgi:hypothetical protein